MKLPSPPINWGSDGVTKFIDDTRRNCFASYAKLHRKHSQLTTIDGIFRKLIDSLVNTRDWFAAFFLLRAHCSFLSGAQLAMSGQVAEAHGVLRLSLENALYGFYFAENPDSRETWLQRHDSIQAKKKVRDEFRIGNIFSALARRDAQERDIAKELYDRTIDYGAHPNERSLTQSLKITEEQDIVDFQIIYLSGDSKLLQSCIRTAAQVGACVLAIFSLVYKERFDIIGLSTTLAQLRREI